MVKQLYIAWTRYQRRPISMREDFGYELVFVPPVTHSRLTKGLLSYPVQTMRTLYHVLARRPDVLWIQAPPNVIIHVAWLARMLRGNKLRVIADLHNAALSRFWFALPLTRRLLNSFDVLLVHNEVIRRDAMGKGLSGERLDVLEDRTPVIKTVSEANGAARPYMVMPCSFSRDEPVFAVIEAARLLPEVDFRITGDRRTAQDQGFLDDCPPNVDFTGFLDAADYERLIGGCTGMLCLTTRDGIQLSSAMEAVGAGKPLIISDTPLLRSLFARGLFVDNTPAGLRDACRAVKDDYQRYADATLTLRTDGERGRRWQDQAQIIKLKL